MGVNYFTDEQVIKLRANPNVRKVSNKGITYTESFKNHFLSEHMTGKIPRQIFEESGFEYDILGESRIHSCDTRWRAQSNRLEGLKDTRKGHSGRPSTKDLTQEEIIERQKLQIEYLKQERDFLLELERLERKAIKKGKSSRAKNTNSSKK